jgi:hypothetical protein
LFFLSLFVGGGFCGGGFVRGTEVCGGEFFGLLAFYGGFFFDVF